MGSSRFLGTNGALKKLLVDHGCSSYCERESSSLSFCLFPLYTCAWMQLFPHQHSWNVLFLLRWRKPCSIKDFWGLSVWAFFINIDFPSPLYFHSSSVVFCWWLYDSSELLCSFCCSIRQRRCSTLFLNSRGECCFCVWVPSVESSAVCQQHLIAYNLIVHQVPYGPCQTKEKCKEIWTRVHLTF